VIGTKLPGGVMVPVSPSSHASYPIAHGADHNAEGDQGDEGEGSSSPGLLDSIVFGDGYLAVRCLGYELHDMHV
jgi:hypothetical protein